MIPVAYPGVAVQRASKRYETRFSRRSRQGRILVKAITFALVVATMGERLPEPGGGVEIVDKDSGDVVAVHLRKVLPADVVKRRIDQDLEGDVRRGLRGQVDRVTNQQGESEPTTTVRCTRAQTSAPNDANRSARTSSRRRLAPMSITAASASSADLTALRGETSVKAASATSELRTGPPI